MTSRATARSAQGPSGRVREVMLRVFTSANRRVMLPLLSHRIVGAWAGSPLTGYFLTLTTTGRRTGLPRRTPLNGHSGGTHLCALRLRYRS